MSKTWDGGDSVELDAIEPHLLRQLCEAAIEALLPEDWLQGVKGAEASERQLLATGARTVTAEPAT